MPILGLKGNVTLIIIISLVIKSEDLLVKLGMYDGDMNIFS